MWAAAVARGIEKPVLDQQQAADLFAYLYFVGYQAPSGRPRKGAAVWQTKQCQRCHSGDALLQLGTKPRAELIRDGDPIQLTLGMWNHAVDVWRAAAREGIPFPKLAPEEMVDLMAYLGSGAGVLARAMPQPGSAARGRELFDSKSCVRCHVGELDLAARRTRYNAAELAAKLWNHPPAAGPVLSRREMSDILSYLVVMQFQEERGNPDHGREVLAKRGCGRCHGGDSGPAPDFTELRGRMTSYGLIAALSRHGPAMLERLRQQGMGWPRLSAEDMADATAYLHGPEFKRRAAKRPGP